MFALVSAPPRPHAVAHPPAWFAAAITLAFVDATATAGVVRGPEGEANPVMAALIGRIGVAPAMVVRVAVAFVLLAALLRLARRSAAAARALVLTTAVHAAVVAWHVAGRVLLLA